MASLIQTGTRLVAVDICGFFGIERYKAFKRGANDPLVSEYAEMPSILRVPAYNRNQFRESHLPEEASFLTHYKGYANVSTQYQRVWVKLLPKREGHPPVYEVTGSKPEYSASQLRS